jgi:tRNA nucleotidyltransferase/poly(A) polymerase
MIRCGPIPLDRCQRRLATALLAASETFPCHLVGGALRDSLLGRFGGDLDAVVGGGRGAEIAARLAERLGARLIRLGGESFASYRLVGTEFVFDLWDRGEQSLFSDLKRRDFTINAMALDPMTGELFDPLRGLTDLRSRRLRATTERTFIDDPLRVLRMIRLAAELADFAISSPTFELARCSVAALGSIATERVREELLKTLEAPNASTGVELMAELAVFPSLWRQDPAAGDSRGDLCEAARRFQRRISILQSLRPTVKPFGSRSASWIALICRVHASGDTAKAAVLASDLMDRGYLTRTLLRRVSQLLLDDTLPAGLREARLLIHRAGREWPAALCLLQLLDEEEGAEGQWAAAAERVCGAAEQAEDTLVSPPRLLTGQDLLRLVPSPPGEWIGQALAAITRAQVEGTVSSRAEALELARRLFRSRSAGD